MVRETARTAVVYLLSIGLLSYYGIEVCPFLESMTARQLIGVHAVAFLIGFACRTLLVYRLRRQEAVSDDREYEADLERPWKYLQVDLGCWLLIGLLVTAWNAAIYDFPVGSGLKVILGCFTLGVFTSTSLALDIERRLIHCLSESPRPARFKEGRFLSITTKFLIFIGLCIGVICMILLLLIYKDFQLVIEQFTSDEPFQFGRIVREVLFVFAVLFTDLRNFTPFSERCSPQEVVQVLNEYFSMVVDAVHRHRGILDKFIGDAAMAVFGLEGGRQPCAEAVATAADIRRGLAALNRELAGRDLPPLECGIGIHFGPLVAGNIGSRERMEYTVIGDTVNTASRLEQLTKELPAPVALSEEVFQHLEESVRSRLQHLGEHQLKGKAAPLPVYGTADP